METHIYGHALRAPRPPPPNGLGSPASVMWFVMGLIRKPSFFCGVGSLWAGIPLPPSPPVVWVLWVGIPLPPPLLWCGSCGWAGIPSFPVVWGLVGDPPPSPRWCGVWWGRVRAGKSWWARGGREASLARQTIFCGRKFCSETLGCPFKCFGRPWRFLLGTIRYRAMKSVLMTSKPPIIDYTLCHILYLIYSRVFSIYYRLYSVYMVYIYTIARPLKGGNQVLHTSLRAMWEPDYSTLQHTIVQYNVSYYSVP